MATKLSMLIEFIPNYVYYTQLAVDPEPREGLIYFCIDKKLQYNNFYLDFGPLSLGCTFQFCNVMNKMLASAVQTKRKIYFYSSPDPKLRANAVCLLGCWGVLFQGMAPEVAFTPFASMAFPSFHDASPVECKYRLDIIDCLKGVAKAVQSGYVHPPTFDVHDYHHYEQVENGDLTWISPKFLAFAGPHDKYSVSPEGYVALTPEHYIPYFKKKHVTLVVRLNEKMYDERRFTRAGIAHLNLYYPDGTNPPEYILKQFIDACEATSGAVAVHCKAGLGRTGTCIGAYMMKHHFFTAKEAIGWLRLCRPGSVIGPQQQYMDVIQPKMWQAGGKHDNRGILEKALPGVIASMFTLRAPEATPPPSPRSPGHTKPPLPKTSAVSSQKDKAGTQGDNLVRLKQTYQHHYVR
ncbi:TPA: hypothetical protein N0F65_004477 [Lagenidium giganteum]|uniref:protein-tyrosine-phosphatase n=1 Tax=Lagenidium giganteum TaxID=4803 RepID=A0AAV2ZGG3_9STRA|nr:TPA: hypothetical protein N0F65_004477 [Lagenidium giganteum]